jgi:hypothetical protein
MRNITAIGIIAAAATLALAQSASAERVCRSVCDGGACVQKCVEHDDRAIIDHDRVPRPREPGVDIHAPGVNVDVK